MPEIILGNLPAATTPLTGSERVPMDQRVGGTIAATALTPGLGYAIVSVGTTNWVTCGVPAGVTPAVGLVFTCLAVGTGTGTAQQVETVDAAASDVAALAPPTNLSYDPATRLLSSSTGADVTLPLAGPTTAGLLPPTNDGLSLASLTVTGTLTAPHIHGALAGPLYIHVRNAAGVSLPAGSTVHVIDNQGDTDRMLIVLARADNQDTLPANGILLETLAPNADGHAVNLGELTGFNTSGLTAGAQVFVAPTGGLTMTRPASNPQAIATVGRVHSSTGSILVNASPVLSTVAFTGAYSDLTGRPSLATVATTGAYGDLTGRPPEISQADAEAGSGTVFSLWSAQRWRQAAANWWQTVTSAVGRSLVGAADAPAARTILGLGTAAPLDVAASGNASTSQVVRGDDTRLSDARTPLAHTQAASTISDSTATGRAVLTAADAPAARTAIAAAGSGAITSSGLTMATARILGRTTAGAGAVEEIQVAGGALAGGVLTITGYDPTTQFTNTRNSAASSPSLLITGTVFSGGTATTTQPHIFIQPTGAASPTVFNTGGTVLGANMSSGFTGDFAWFGVNGTRMFRFSPTSSSFGPTLTIGGDYCSIVYASTYPLYLRNNNGTPTHSFRPDGVFYFGSDINADTNGVALVPEGHNILALRSFTSTQTFRVYNTWTSSTNFERARVSWSSNTFIVGTEKGSGGGTARSMHLQTDATTRLALDTVGSVQLTTGLTVATLPATPLIGMIARVTDATSPALGASVSGGGSSFAIVCYNGASWTVMGI